MKLIEALQGVTLLGLDTAPVIYFIEAAPRYDALVTEVFRKISDGEIARCSSVITLTEVMTLPMRTGNAGLVNTYRDLLLNGHNFNLLPIDLAIGSW